MVQTAARTARRSERESARASSSPLNLTAYGSHSIHSALPGSQLPRAAEASTGFNHCMASL